MDEMALDLVDLAFGNHGQSDLRLYEELIDFF